MSNRFSNIEIIKAIHRSQHCQRNWDLESTIDAADLETLKTAVTQCPSKQNMAFYKVHFIQDRALIEAVHDCTKGFTVNYREKTYTTNTQTLANLLVVFEWYEHIDDPERNEEALRHSQDASDPVAREIFDHNRKVALGIAAGYLNLTASLLGYATGCCACFERDKVKEILGLENNAMLLMGVGVKNPSLNRRIHHVDQDFVFPIKPKQEIPFTQR
jgi:nitroreductase